MDIFPIFPLRMTAFPYANLSLRVFEQRYLRMTCEVMKQQQCFVITPLLDGAEGSPDEQQFAQVGCLVRVDDFHKQADGLLELEVHGLERVNIGRRWQEADGLWRGEVERWPEAEEPLGVDHGCLIELFEAMCTHPLIARDSPVRCQQLPNANVLSWKLGSCLPLPPVCQLQLLQAESATQRLALIHGWLDHDMEC
ncbi:LON peptidase substrate-binding domain-containing protein [Pokkaliibacter sp. MBI-7]|uniref:LON peptidase substrate-binding domain-containing protein n=1 Tax=Pokkaliibacter sp. MBI-7 TaxID=3040600 RepID=UPI002448C0F0|nr:LON peptidase substrate-binding domain-containing protein [Pokkaliibacter sp. MBI-7]MDH2431877.1 LON peptidase substrate-binding domain-containing protein [Pokkaliibacter sp. MBI-7]